MSPLCSVAWVPSSQNEDRVKFAVQEGLCFRQGRRFAYSLSKGLAYSTLDLFCGPGGAPEASAMPTGCSGMI